MLGYSPLCSHNKTPHVTLVLLALGNDSLWIGLFETRITGTPHWTRLSCPAEMPLDMARYQSSRVWKGDQLTAFLRQCLLSMLSAWS